MGTKEPEFEVIWDGSKPAQVGHTKGELLGSYNSESSLNNPHPYLTGRVRDKLGIKANIKKEENGK